MKNKSSDDTSRVDGSPEHNQEPAEKSKIKLLDVVALTQDIPEHNLKSGEIGTVVEILSNDEVFEVEFSDDNGQMYKCTSFFESQLEVLPYETLEANLKMTNKELHIRNVMLKKYEELSDHWESGFSCAASFSETVTTRLLALTRCLYQKIMAISPRSRGICFPIDITESERGQTWGASVTSCGFLPRQDPRYIV